MPEPTVTVIIPAYNAEPYIADTIESCIAQSLATIEIIVVDDGSTDDTHRIASEFRDARLQVHRKPNGGVSSARNYALARAQGRYIQFLDADDVLEARKLEMHVRKLHAAGDCGVSTSKWGWFVDDVTSARFTPSDDWRDLEPAEFGRLKFGGGGMMPTNSWLVPRDVIGDLRFRSWLDAAEDSQFLAELVKRSTRISFAEEAISYYRKQNANSVSQQWSYSICVRQYMSLSMIADIMLQLEDSERMRLAMANAFLNCAVRIYALAPDLASEAERRARSLGPATFDPLASGGVFGSVGRFVGWKSATRLRHLYNITRSRVGAGR